MRETDKLIAEWLGHKCNCGGDKYHEDYCYFYLPENFSDDSKAVLLLPELVKRGYSPCLDYQPEGWVFEI